MDWHTFIAKMPDYRVNRRKKHHLVDILVIALCALLSGADDFEKIEAYGRRKEAFLRTFLDLANGIPSHDTFTRVFRRMDTDAFGRCLYTWSAQMLTGVKGPLQTVSVDGKVLQGDGAVRGPRKWHLHHQRVGIGAFAGTGPKKSSGQKQREIGHPRPATGLGFTANPGHLRLGGLPVVQRQPHCGGRRAVRAGPEEKPAGCLMSR